MSNPIPNIPPLSSIQDPNTRAVLQALINGWNVRNGNTGKDEDRFITLADLKNGLNFDASSNTFIRGGGAGADGAGGVAGKVSDVFQKLLDSISATKLWKTLSSRITRIESPDWAKYQLGPEISRVENKVSDDLHVLAEEISTVSANFSGNIAAVEKVVRANATEFSAFAEDVTTLAVKMGKNIALARDSMRADVSPTGVNIGDVTTLQGAFGALEIVAEESMNVAVNNKKAVEGAWTVKFDIDGYVAGAGLGVEGKNGKYTSDFMVRADRFVIANPTIPGKPAYVPFVVDNSGVYINGQLRVGGQSLLDIAGNAAVPAINYIGEFASHPDTNGRKANSVYKNTTNGNSYIMQVPGDGGTDEWVLWLANGTDGKDAQGIVESYCFIRNPSGYTPSTPTGGSYTSPQPNSPWSDGIPAGTLPVWMSKRIFTSNGLSPQTNWSTPVMTATPGDGTRLQFSQDGWSSWHDIPSENDWYMRKGTSTDGGASWVYQGAVKIKGEQGPQGYSGTDGKRGSLTVSATGNGNTANISNTFWSASGRSDKVFGDCVAFSGDSNTGAGSGSWYRTADNSDYWTKAALYLDGDLVVNGTIYAKKIANNAISQASSASISGAGGTFISGGFVVPSFDAATASDLRRVIVTASYVADNNTAAKIPCNTNIFVDGGTVDVCVSNVAKDSSTVITRTISLEVRSGQTISFNAVGVAGVALLTPSFTGITFSR